MTDFKPASAIPFSFSLEGADPITMLARPSDMSFNYKKRLNRYMTRGGWIEEDWGDDLDHISGNGFSDAFIHASWGTCRVNAIETPQYNYFQSLVSMYRNNGFVWDRTTGQVIEAVYESDLAPVENVVMKYRGSVYRGYFESFNWTESADDPFRFSWSFEYVVVCTVYGY